MAGRGCLWGGESPQTTSLLLTSSPSKGGSRLCATGNGARKSLLCPTGTYQPRKAPNDKINKTKRSSQTWRVGGAVRRRQETGRSRLRVLCRLHPTGNYGYLYSCSPLGLWMGSHFHWPLGTQIHEGWASPKHRPKHKGYHVSRKTKTVVTDWQV